MERKIIRKARNFERDKLEQSLISRRIFFRPPLFTCLLEFQMLLQIFSRFLCLVVRYNLVVDLGKRLREDDIFVRVLKFGVKYCFGLSKESMYHGVKTVEKFCELTLYKYK